MPRHQGLGTADLGNGGVPAVSEVQRMPGTIVLSHQVLPACSRARGAALASPAALTLLAHSWVALVDTP